MITIKWANGDEGLKDCNHFHFLVKSVATLAFGLWPRQGGCEVAGLEVDLGVTSHAPGSAKSPESVREWTLTLPSELPCWKLVRVGVPKWLPKLQRAFWGVKTQWLVALFISMKRSWNVDIENGLALAIRTSEAQVMGKRRAGSQTGSLTPDH